MTRISTLACGVWLAATAIAFSQDRTQETYVDAAKAGADFGVQGEYQGAAGPASIGGLHVIAQGDGKFTGVLYAKGLPGAGWDGKTKLALTGETVDGVVKLTGTNFRGTIQGGVMKADLDGVALEYKKIERQSPTLGAPAPEGAIVLFDGKNVDAWQGGKLVEEGLLGVGTRTKRKFKDFTLHLEFRTPYMPFARGQARGNSGLYLNDQYEFQILDSFGLAGENNECGGYYSFAKPKLNMCLPSLAWQTYDVDFTMARFDANGVKTRPAVATIRLNGVVIHENYEIPKFNGGGGLADESQSGSIFVQDHGNPVHFRNIWIVER
ncbi:MAG: DUF1080 domain-containing protein [Planctomycetota bacterium]|nr:DUF1080 domain-containing protein [Planctomycetota bacterium]